MTNLDLQRRGLLCVVSGPSGSGKTTLCRRFSDEDKGATYAISATTRDPRAGEENGIDYFFMTREEFETKATKGEFLEYAEVHGNLYGTLKSEVIRHISEGRDVLMDLDVQGAALIREQGDTRIQEAFVDVFILLPSDDELLKRLGVRGTESQEQVDLRLHNAHEEIRHWKDYRYTIISEDKETDFANFGAIINGERRRSTRLKEKNAEKRAGDHPELDL